MIPAVKVVVNDRFHTDPVPVGCVAGAACDVGDVQLALHEVLPSLVLGGRARVGVSGRAGARGRYMASAGARARARPRPRAGAGPGLGLGLR